MIENNPAGRIKMSEELQEITELPVETEKHNPSDIAAAFFFLNEKKFNNVLKTLSARQLRRVMMSVASYPLKGDYNPRTENEKSAAYLFNEMTFNRSIMQLEEEARRFEQALAAEQEREALTQTTNEGVTTNG
jgi:hypothetical protein